MVQNAQGQIERMDKLRVHADRYASHSKCSFLTMEEIWSDLETDDDQQRQELEDVMSKAMECWTSAVAGLKARQQAVREHIQQALTNIMSIKEELGTDNPAADADLQRLQGNRSAHRTLRAWEVDVLSKASYWEQCRRQRLADFEDLQARIRLLRQLCGLPPQPPPIERPDISRANMEFLKLELERLATEKERREDLLRRQLDDLSVLCADLGEDVKLAVAEVHPNLVNMWDADAARVLRDVYRLGSAYSSAPSGMVDLSDTTISRLSSKLTIMKDLKASRCAHAAEVLSVLNSLWDATEVPEQERAHFVRMMSGPLRLHAASLEKCMSEVRRLEDVRYQQMVDLVLSKGAELTAMCVDSHVAEPPGLQEALRAIHGSDRNPGAAAELLAKLLHMLAEVQVLTAKRATIITAINEVEAAQQEDVWLTAYEADEQRYKGRDANKKLQRAIRGAKLREKLPGMIAELRALLAEWKDCEGEPFLFDGRDYEFEVLDSLAAAVEEAAAARAAKVVRSSSSNRRMSLAPPSPNASSTTASRLGPGTPMRKSMAAGVGSSGARAGPMPRPVPGGFVGASPAPRRAGGPSTPMPLRGVSNCSLRERHSICVVRDSAPMAGPAALTRSGEVHLHPEAHSTRRSSGASQAKATSAGSPAAWAASLRQHSSDTSASPGHKGLPSPTAAAGSTGHSPAPAAAAEGSFRTPPPRRISRDVPLATPELHGTPADSSCKRVSTSSKLHSIFSRTSVQHPVATLNAEPVAAADSATAADQDA